MLEMLQNDSPGTGDVVLKKIPSKNIFSSWRKMILKILIFKKKVENFDFFNRKIDFSIEKIKMFNFF